MSFAVDNDDGDDGDGADGDAVVVKENTCCSAGDAADVAASDNRSK